MTLKEFIKEYTGVKNVGNTVGNAGQCVGLVMVWVENLELSHFWGHAKDLYYNAPSDEWEKIPNRPSNYPEAGDIIIWDGNYAGSGGYGHTALVLFSNSNQDSFTVLEQNNPQAEYGLQCEITTYNKWNNITGWIRPIDYYEDEQFNEDYINCLAKVSTLDLELDEMRESRDKHRDKTKELDKVIEKQEKELRELIEENNNLKNKLELCQKGQVTDLSAKDLLSLLIGKITKKWQ